MGSREQALTNTQVGTYGTEGEQLDWSYYDTAVIAASVAPVRLFTNPLGAGGKMLDDTNLTQAGQIPQGQLLDVRALKIFYFANTVYATTAPLLDLYRLIARTVISIKLANKETMGQWTVQEIMGVSTLVQLAAVAGSTGGIQPRYHGIFPLNKKLILAALTPFEVTMTHSVAPSADLVGDRLRFSLSGILTRVS